MELCSATTWTPSIRKSRTQFFTEILEATAASDGHPTGPGGAPGAGKVRVRDALQQTLRVSAAHLATQTPAMRSAVLSILKNFLAMPGPWLESSVLLKEKDIKAAFTSLPEAQKASLPSALPCERSRRQFGTAGLGTTAHGTPIVWLVKRPLVATEASYARYVNMLTAIDFRVATYQALSHVQEGVDQPPTSPTLTLPPVPTEADAVPGAALLRGLKQASADFAGVSSQKQSHGWPRSISATWLSRSAASRNVRKIGCQLLCHPVLSHFVLGLRTVCLASGEPSSLPLEIWF